MCLPMNEYIYGAVVDSGEPSHMDNGGSTHVHGYQACMGTSYLGSMARSMDRDRMMLKHAGICLWECVPYYGKFWATGELCMLPFSNPGLWSTQVVLPMKLGSHHVYPGSDPTLLQG